MKDQLFKKHMKQSLAIEEIEVPGVDESGVSVSDTGDDRGTMTRSGTREEG